MPSDQEEPDGRCNLGWSASGFHQRPAGSGLPVGIWLEPGKSGGYRWCRYLNVEAIHTQLVNMPQRSNEFQRLVYLLKLCAGRNTVVQESALVPDSITGALVEVDIWITTVVGGHDIHVGIECRDHARKQGVEWLNEMKAKHERLPTSKLVLVSRSGFAERTRRLAKAYNIDLSEFGEFDESAASRLLTSLSMSARSVEVLPQAVHFVVEDSDCPSGTRSAEADVDWPVFRSDGSPSGTAQDLVRAVTNSELMAREVRRVSKTCRVQFHSTVSNAGSPLLVQIPGESVRRVIQSVDIEAVAVFDSAEGPTRRASVDGAQVTWTSFQLKGEQVTMLATEKGNSTWFGAYSVDSKP